MRVLLKLSGETLLGNQSFGINFQSCQTLANTLAHLKNQGLEIAIVIGGGNIFRGIKLTETTLPRSPADTIGMLATLMNGIALQEALKACGCPATAMSSFICPQAAIPYNWSTANTLLSEGQILLFVGGTGNPYFTTDTAAALRACEIQADALWKATNVDGVYPADPRTHPNLKQYDTLTYADVLAQKLSFMDATAISLCQTNNIPITVFNKTNLYTNDFLTQMTQNAIGTRIIGE